MSRKVVTRFAPSPTGYLHIGGARTALFNWLFSRHYGGDFLLRIEDTDRARSTDDAIRAIMDGMRWLGLEWDGEVFFQFARAARHAEVAKKMVEQGSAYYCYATTEELEALRQQAQAEGKAYRYDGRWRDASHQTPPLGVKPAIRLKAPMEGETIVNDLVQGRVVLQNDQLDDMVLLRADSTPTYMLAVVVDDHDMGITHVIRGDDHFTNAFRQAQVYAALGWEVPEFAHIPLIHGADGAKLSKRHGAVGLEMYRDMGFLPEAMRNYLLRLGWSHGDEEIIPTAKAIEWFGLEAVGKSPSRFDMAKLENLNAHYLRDMDDGGIARLALPFVQGILRRELREMEVELLREAVPALKARAKTLVEFAEGAAFYFASEPLALNDKAREILTIDARKLLGKIMPVLQGVEWETAKLEAAIKTFAERQGVKLGVCAQPLRAALTGSSTSPGIFEVMELLGREKTLLRLSQQEVK